MDKNSLLQEKLRYEYSNGDDNFSRVRLTLIESPDQFISLDVEGTEYNGIFSVQDMDVFISNGEDGWMELKDKGLIQFFINLCNIERLIINALSSERGIYVNEVQF